MSRRDNKRNEKASGRGKNNSRGKSSARGNAPIGKTKRDRKPNPTVAKTAKGKNITVRKTEGIRLNKYIANSGICSRREADTYIATGLVTVNGKTITEMGHKVNLDDDVRFDGRRINPEPMVYVLLNKPKGYATTTSNSKGATVMDLIANASSARVTPIGRLGRNATGLLFFTNDDKLKQKLSKKGMERLFHIELDKNLKASDLDRVKEGLLIDGKKVEVEEISYVANSPKKEIGLKIKNMGNSIIRDIFDHLGYNIVRLDCVTLAHLTKKDLPRGRWKILTKREVELFSML